MTPPREAGHARPLIVHAVGDIGFGSRFRLEAMPGAGADPFAGAVDLLKGADLLFGNLETPLVPDGMHPVLPEIVDGFAGAPEQARWLSAHGFDVVSLANNHVMDYGPAGLRSTLEALEREGVRHAGAGWNLDEARRPALIDASGVHVALLAYAREGRHSAGPGVPGAAPLREEMVLEDVARARESAEVVIVSLHFGLVYSDYPRPEDQALARRICAAGASLILGHHPHVLQGIERVGDSAVAYSLGEFLFDPAAGHVVNRSAERIRRESGVFQVRLEGVRVGDCRLAPTLRHDSTLFPVAAGRETSEAIEDRVRRISSPLAGDALSSAEIQGSTARRTAAHQWDVFAHHLKRGHVGILARWLVRLRPRHVALGLRAFVSRLRGGGRP